MATISVINNYLELDVMKKYIAEFFGTFWLVLGGCGSAVLAANFGGEGNPLGLVGGFSWLWSNGSNYGLCCGTYFRRSF